MRSSEIEEILRRCTFKGLVLRLVDTEFPPYLQVECPEGTCNVTGRPESWKGRKWRLSHHMTKSEIVQTAFMAVMAAIEHEARETFRYCGRPIFGPHFDVEKLVALCEAPDSQDARS